MNTKRLDNLIKAGKKEAQAAEDLGYSPDIGMDKSYAYWMGYVRGIEDARLTSGEKEADNAS